MAHHQKRGFQGGVSGPLPEDQILRSSAPIVPVKPRYRKLSLAVGAVDGNAISHSFGTLCWYTLSDLALDTVTPCELQINGRSVRTSSIE